MDKEKQKEGQKSWWEGESCDFVKLLDPAKPEAVSSSMNQYIPFCAWE